MFKINLSLNRVLLLLALVLAAGLFLWRLNDFPPGLYIDEALYGYSAHSILETGRDEWGMPLPFFFRFYGSYNPPLYVYLTAISLKLFGLSAAGVRLMSALFGTAGVVGMYWLARSLWPKHKTTAPLAALVLASSPWVLLYARTGYEVNPAMVFLLFGMVCLYKGLEKPAWWLGAVVLLSASTYTAYAERLFMPIFLLGFLLIFAKNVFKRDNWPILGRCLAVGIVLHLPHLLLLFTPAFLPKGGELYQGLTGGWLREFWAQYSNYFSPASLFFRPDPDLQRSLPNMAVFFPWLVLPYLVGLQNLWRERKEGWAKFIILALFVFPIPSALTRDPFASHRAFALVIPLVLILALGLGEIKNRLRPVLFWGIFGVLLCGSLVLLVRSYFFTLPATRAVAWMEGYDQIAKEIRGRPQTHFLIEQGRLKPSYANLGFYLPIPPSEFQSRYGVSVSDYYRLPEPELEFSFERLELRPLDWHEDIYREQIIVGDPLSVSESQAKEHFLTRAFEIKSSRGQLLFIGWQTDPVKKCQSELSALRSPLCRN